MLCMVIHLHFATFCFLNDGLDQKHSSNNPIYKWLFLVLHVFTYYKVLDLFCVGIKCGKGVS
jgi:hypothetical protein